MAVDKNGSNGLICTCGCNRGAHWTAYLIRVILTILILMVVFWFGLAVGRLSDYSRYGYYAPMMHDYAYPSAVYNGAGSGGSAGTPSPMMPIRGGTTTPTTNGVQNY